jgi:hypothetical protein
MTCRRLLDSNLDIVNSAMSGDRPLEILLICDRVTGIAATVFDHIHALEKFSRHTVRRLEILGDIPASLDLNRFDVIVVHYTLVLCSDYYISPSARQRLARARALKAMFIQDEYRFVDKTIAAMKEVGIDLLFTCVPEEEIEKVYPARRLPGVIKVNVLTGYVPERLLKLPLRPLSERQIDVGYRSRDLPAWLGRLAQEKMFIGRRFQEDAKSYGLKLDISAREEDRLYGDNWIRFVRNCKAVLGVESGASVFDFTGEIQRKVDAHVARDPSVTFDALHDLYFAEAEGQIRLAQISPRCFESAALGTLMIMYEGNYSGILEPWRHYVPLKKDHSNFDEVISVLKDLKRATEIVSCAHQEIALNPRYSFKASVAQVDDWIERCMRSEMRTTQPAYAPGEFRRVAAPTLFTWKKRMRRDAAYAMYRFVFGRLLRGLPDAERDQAKRWIGLTLRSLRNVRHVVRLVLLWPFKLVRHLCRWCYPWIYRRISALLSDS